MDSFQEQGSISSDIFKFGPFFLNPKERRLAFSGRFIDIKPRAFDILTYLVSRSGEVVSKDELLEVVWEGNFVEEGNLAVHVSKLRKMFDANAGVNFIQTLSGVGYSFVEPAEVASEEEWKEAVKDAIPLIDVFPIEDARDSIAVMPLFNENLDEELDYLADGLTEALINNLSCRPNLRVIARNTVFRFKNKDVDAKEVGRLLNVNHILTGRIRISGDDISLSVELSASSDGSQVWGARYDKDFSEIIEMQDAITNSICDRLNNEIGKSLSNSARLTTNSSESYRLFLKAKFFIERRSSVADVARAKELFHEAISLNPILAEAYVGLANCLRVSYLYHQISKLEAKSQIDELLQRGREINPIMYEYFLLRGYIEMFLDFDFRKAEMSFHHAISLSPASAISYNYLARLHIYRGDIQKGLRVASETARLDPISYQGDKALAKIFIMTGQYENAVFRLKECLEFAPDDFEASVLLGFAKTELKEFEEAKTSFDLALAKQFHTETVAMRGYACARSGDVVGVDDALKILEKSAKDMVVPKSLFAAIYAGLGDIETAIDYLEETYEEGYVDIVAVKVDPRWSGLRGNTRFEKIVQSLGL